MEGELICETPCTSERVFTGTKYSKMFLANFAITKKTIVVGEPARETPRVHLLARSIRGCVRTRKLQLLRGVVYESPPSRFENTSKRSSRSAGRCCCLANLGDRTKHLIFFSKIHAQIECRRRHVPCGSY